MAIQHWEAFPSRETRDVLGGGGSSAKLTYYLTGSSDEIALRNYIKPGGAAGTPLAYDGLVYTDAALKPLGIELWQADLTYGWQDDDDAEEPKDTGSLTLSFDTTGGTVRVTNSRHPTVKYAPPGLQAADFKGAINVTDNGVEGVDTVIPQLRFTIDYMWPWTGQLSHFVTYVKRLYALTGKTNDKKFYGFAAGELLFLGVHTSARPRGDFQMQLQWDASPNVTNLQIGDIVGIAKQGHQYLWVKHTKKKDAAANPPRIVDVPGAVYVETLYDQADYGVIGIQDGSQWGIT